MTTFDERERAFEEKYHHDEELRFKVHARRNKLLGLWVAGRLGLAGKEAEDYALTVVEADFEEPGDEDVVRKVLGDLTEGGIDITVPLIRREMERLLVEARRQIMEE